MNIAISLNQKYFYYTYVMLTSLFENEREECIDVYLTHSGLDEASIEAFSKLAAKYGNNIYSMHIDRDFFPDSLPISDAWSIEMYFRLALIDLLPQHVDRILYLDVDTIVTNSLTGIYNEDFEDKCFVVCEDTSTLSMVGQKRYELFKELLDEGYRYFNSGVMLWNIKKLRGRFDLSKYISMFIELSDYISSPDQDLLNYIHHAICKVTKT